MTTEKHVLAKYVQQARDQMERAVHEKRAQRKTSDDNALRALYPTMFAPTKPRAKK